MPAPHDLLVEVAGCRKEGGSPNLADSHSTQSKLIAEHWLAGLGLASNIVGVAGQTLGNRFESVVARHLAAELPVRRPERRWAVQHPGRRLAEFAQYAHLGRLSDLIDADQTGTLAIAVGRDYEIAPDITIGEAVPEFELPLLHATVSCKATIRSDRAQNVRLEAFMLSRHRNGRLPHIVVVTGEPLPSRLASLCRGTGDIDAVYHLALPELEQAVAEVGSSRQRAVLNEIVGQNRLLDFSSLVLSLSR